MTEGEQDRDTRDSGTTSDPPREPYRPGFTRQLRGVARQHRGAAILAAIVLLLLLAAAVAGTGLAIWAFHEESQARKAERQAVQKEKKAEEVAADYKEKFHQSEATWKATAQELQRAQATLEAARRSEQETKDVLDFFKKTLLSAGRPGDGTSLAAAFWAAGRGQDVTLRKALDSTESRVSETFADRPRAEAATREMLGLGYLNVGEPARSVQQYQRALDLREATQGPAHPDAAACRNQLAVAYRLAGRTTEAALLFDRQPHSPAHAAALAARGLTLLHEKKPAEAELKLRESLTIRRKTQPGDWTTFDTESALGEALLDQKRFAEAETPLLSAYEGLKQRADAIPAQERPCLAKALERLVKLYEAWGKEDQAARWHKELEAAQVAKKS